MAAAATGPVPAIVATKTSGKAQIAGSVTVQFWGSSSHWLPDFTVLALVVAIKRDSECIFSKLIYAS
jgi:hypothetical protein